jgi:galactose-1-phosphate uridylyltransferase
MWGRFINMTEIRKIYPDGTEKQTNPFTGMVVWHVPGRSDRPILTKSAIPVKRLERQKEEDYCNFCPALYFNATPEKARVVLQKNNYEQFDGLAPEAIFSSPADFRRIGNLYEIATFNYWQKNYGYQMPSYNQDWMEEYASSSMGIEHLCYMLDMKNGPKNPKGLSSLKNRNKLLELAAPFFGGSHEIIIPQRHFTKGAEFNNQLFFAGEMTPEEHFQYFKFTINSMNNIYTDNPFVKYVSVFQNWLKDSGASFEHLHRQLLGIDEYGEIINRKITMERKDSGVFNKLALNWAIKNNLVVAENENAVAFVDVGFPYPTVAIYSKGKTADPRNCSEAEIRSVSELVHAIQKAAGPMAPSNEEWYYTPRDSNIYIPWHILIKLRTNIIAGFEGGTNIFVNPLSLEDLRNEMVDKLKDFLELDKIDKMKIGKNCKTELNSLAYN